LRPAHNLLPIRSCSWPRRPPPPRNSDAPPAARRAQPGPRTSASTSANWRGASATSTTARRCRARGPSACSTPATGSKIPDDRDKPRCGDRRGRSAQGGPRHLPLGLEGPGHPPRLRALALARQPVPATRRTEADDLRPRPGRRRFASPGRLPGRPRRAGEGLGRGQPGCAAPSLTTRTRTRTAARCFPSSHDCRACRGAPGPWVVLLCSFSSSSPSGEPS